MDDELYMWRKKVDKDLREWIETTGCRRDVTDSYFGNPPGRKRTFMSLRSFTDYLHLLQHPQVFAATIVRGQVALFLITCNHDHIHQTTTLASAASTQRPQNPLMKTANVNLLSAHPHPHAVALTSKPPEQS
jgi:hypothetical protein